MEKLTLNTSYYFLNMCVEEEFVKKGANLLKYTLCFISVLDWYLNNPDSPAYTSDPMHIWRISEEDGKPLFSVPLRNDQNKLLVEGIKANYKKSAK